MQAGGKMRGGGGRAYEAGLFSRQRVQGALREGGEGGAAHAWQQQVALATCSPTRDAKLSERVCELNWNTQRTLKVWPSPLTRRQMPS